MSLTQQLLPTLKRPWPLRMQALNRWRVRLKHMLHNDCCRLCFDMPVRGEMLFCNSCRETLSLREPYPVAMDTDNGYTVHAAALMSPEIKNRLYPHKFYHQHDHVLTLAHVMLDYWHRLHNGCADHAAGTVWFVAIPARETNHLSAIGREFAYALNQPLWDTLLSWKKTTSSQHTLAKRSQRIDNMRDAFEVDPYTWEMAVNAYGLPQKIVVVDDLTTTGATFQASHQAFRRWLKHLNLAIPVEHLALSHVPFQFRHQQQVATLLDMDVLAPVQ